MLIGAGVPASCADSAFRGQAKATIRRVRGPLCRFEPPSPLLTMKNFARSAVRKAKCSQNVEKGRLGVSLLCAAAQAVPAQEGARTSQSPFIAEIHSRINCNPSRSTADRPNSGIMTFGSADAIRCARMDASG